MLEMFFHSKPLYKRRLPDSYGGRTVVLGKSWAIYYPLIPKFYSSTMEVTKLHVWVLMPSLSLPFWHHQTLKDIGNALGKFIKIDSERITQLFTYACICVEINLSKGLPYRIQLNNSHFRWTQSLDYKSMTFICRRCNQTWHLHDSRPLAKKLANKRKVQQV